jgi:hypothetical protein
MGGHQRHSIALYFSLKLYSGATKAEFYQIMIELVIYPTAIIHVHFSVHMRLNPNMDAADYQIVRP